MLLEKEKAGRGNGLFMAKTGEGGGWIFSLTCFSVFSPSSHFSLSLLNLWFVNTVFFTSQSPYAHLSLLLEKEVLVNKWKQSVTEEETLRMAPKFRTLENRSWCSVTQSCLTLCDPMDCSLPGSSVHGIFQARILEWVAISFSNLVLDFLIKLEARSNIFKHVFHISHPRDKS